MIIFWLSVPSNLREREREREGGREFVCERERELERDGDRVRE